MASELSRRSVLALGLSGAASLAGCATEITSAPFPRAQSIIDAYVRDRKISGAVLALTRGGATAPVFLRSGTIALNSAQPAEPDTLYRVYSMSKPITGIATMMLIGEGRLGLDQPISDILPEFANPRVLVNAETMETRPAAGPILVRHCLTHTSGLSYGINTTGALPPIYRAQGVTPFGRPGDLSPNPLRSLEDFGTRLAALPLSFDPGASIEYSVSLDLLGLVIQRVTGTPFDVFLQQRLFGPLGMSDTGFYVPQDKLERFATNYRVTPEGLRLEDAPPNTPYARIEGVPSGGAGVISTAHDYIRFCSMLLDDGAYNGVRVMTPEAATLARSNIAPNNLRIPPDGHGIAAAMRVVLPESTQAGMPAGQVSWGGAAGTTMWVDRANRFAGAFLTQYMPQDAYPLREEVRAAAYADLAAS
ncbi:beta-lactamase class C and other penicillin binding proteins [alpha proteobacterium U9-1i]|nr:beta-lactamase class C and other penicillin binding proteins [alpha proteobacterium U9-1i]